MNPTVPIEWLDAGAAGIYLLFGVIHLDLWLRRRDRRSHLWLAGASAGALLVDVSGIFLRRSGADPGHIMPALNLLGVLLVTSSIFELVRSLTGGQPTRAARAFYGGLFAFALVIAFGAQHAWLSVFMSCSGLLLLMAMLRAIRGARAGDPESRLVAVGLIVLLLTLLLDILQITNVAPKVPGLAIVGFTALFVISSRALSGRYEREYRELVVLRNELEQRVLERTHELEEANRQLAEMSRTDSLTGLPNRRAFLEASERELHRAARSGQHCSIVMADLDHFKEVNDRHGHAAGDAMLKVAASALRSVLRGEDVVARWGGEEFILFLPNTDGDAARVVAEKARSTLAAAARAAAGTTGGVTASFGIATHRAGRTLEATIAAADRALYRAKEAGRDRVVVEA
jgi:diguanylate cyclase (GGDEF)-like protein